MTQATRILVTQKGETGYLASEVGSDFHIRCAVTLDSAKADTFESPARAERFARKIAGRFERVELEQVA